MVPAPTTVYIEPVVPRILGCDRPLSRDNEYSLRIDFRSALLHGFSLEQFYSIDKVMDEWNIVDEGSLLLMLIIADSTNAFGSRKKGV
jgi:hypothetical protein